MRDLHPRLAEADATPARAFAPSENRSAIDAAKATQRDRDESLGDQAKADALLVPLEVTELTQAQAKALWPDFQDTVPGGL